MDRPLLGSVDKNKAQKIVNGLYRTFLPLCLLWSVLALWQGLHLLHRGTKIGGVLMLLMCVGQLFLAFLFWCVDKAARNPDWQGNWLVRVSYAFPDAPVQPPPNTGQ